MAAKCQYVSKKISDVTGIFQWDEIQDKSEWLQFPLHPVQFHVTNDLYSKNVLHL